MLRFLLQLAKQPNQRNIPPTQAVSVTSVAQLVGPTSPAVSAASVVRTQLPAPTTQSVRATAPSVSNVSAFALRAPVSLSFFRHDTHKSLISRNIASQVRWARVLKPATQTGLRNAKLKTTGKLLSVVGSLKNAKHRVNFNPLEGLYVGHCQYAITDGNNLRPILGASAANFTVIVALYDSKHKIAALAHIAPVNDLASLIPILNRMSREHTVAHLVGADKTELDRIIEILQFLESQKISVLNADVGRLSNGGANSMAIDSRSGDIYSHVTSDDLSLVEYPNDRWAFEKEGAPVRLIYDGAVDINLHDTMQKIAAAHRLASPMRG